MTIPWPVVAVTVALAAAVAACGEGEEEIAPAPTTAGATPAATPTQAAVATPTASPAPTTPGPSGIVKYVDPTYGYSFEYPADWFVHGDPGGGAIVTSYDPQTAKGIGGIPEGVLKVDVGVLAGQTIESYVAQEAANALPGSIEVLSDSNVTFAGLAGRVRDLNLGDPVARQFLAEFRGDLYMVISYAATWDELEKFAHPLDLIVTSFRVDGQ